jgi:GH25 family lysozyme M1 (1,4-beta-N-acetylmuramidase)
MAKAGDTRRTVLAVIAIAVTCVVNTPALKAVAANPDHVAAPNATGIETSSPAPPTSSRAAATATGDDPSLAEMNATHNHSMGSTIPREQQAPAEMKIKSLAVQSLAAGSPTGTPGLDVSGWQVLGRSDWDATYSNGARFAYVKATEGTDYTSSQFSEQYNDSSAAGLLRGAYHFATPNTSSGSAQANFFISNGGGWSPDGRTLPPMLDIEYNPYGDTCYGMAGAAMVSWIKDFSDTVFARTGRLPAIYSTTDWWTRCTGNSTAFAANPLFIARYTTSGSAGTLPAGWPSYTFWQWADSGIFPGDQDVFNGNTAQLATLAVTGKAPLASPILGVGDISGDGHADVLARKPDGTLWLYRGNGKGMLTGPTQIGAGWQVYDALIAPGDVNGDGKPDLLARKPDGTLWFYAGTGTSGSTADGGFGGGIQINSGWSVFDTVLGAGDMTGDGRADLLARKPDGSLWLYPGTGNIASGGFSSPISLGGGWNMFDAIIAPDDVTGDGKQDVLGRKPDGTLWLYAGTGSGTVTPGVQIDSGWGMFDTVTSGGDLNGDGLGDLLGRKPDGTLFYYATNRPSPSPTGLSPGVMINLGWSSFTSVLGGDFTGDGKSDLAARDPNGYLWLYKGTGTTGTDGASGLNPGAAVGSGWGMFSSLLSPGDLNGDRKPDLLGVKSDGTLWYYAGTGEASAPVRPGVSVNTGWNAFAQILAPGDLNGDGRSDLIGVKSDGTMWFYAGDGTMGSSSSGGLHSGVYVGSGWGMFSRIVAPGDLNGDGKPDLLGIKPDGTMWIYAGSGLSGTQIFQPGIRINAGWSSYTTVLGPGDLSGDGKNDLLAIRPDGTLWFYAGSGVIDPSAVAAYFTATPVSTGWNTYS